MKVLSRKLFVQILALAVMLIFFDSTGLSLAASDATGGSNGTANQVATPLNPSKVYFPDFGQTVPEPLLHYWRANGQYNRFGGPMSRAFVDSSGNTVQYFQKLALAYYPALQGTGWELRPYNLGQLYLQAQSPAVLNAAPFARVAAAPNTNTRKYFPESGHFVSNGFYGLYNSTGQLYMWGYPLSEEYSLTLSNGQTFTAQLFERGRMLWSAATGVMVDPNFGTEMSAFNKADISVDLNDAKAPVYNTNLWEHWVDVNLSTQSAIFYEGDIPVRTTLVTTGKPGHETPVGTFHILRRVYNEHMKGGTIGSEDYYDLYNVLYTQYFTWEGHALHYAWWRSVFGVTGSHGCVNLDYSTSEFAWNFLSLGSRVTIHY
ncbi:MAG TPA: L,D-transpeptidase family protein [Chloroflexia bacterium]|nr:L,D-transpeptidase family protein [Chloroflexia bacterium]